VSDHDRQRQIKDHRDRAQIENGDEATPEALTGAAPRCAALGVVAKRGPAGKRGRGDSAHRRPLCAQPPAACQSMRRIRHCGDERRPQARNIGYL
jgi:hypothetical protein